MRDVYYTPEDCGLKIMWQIEDTEAYYEFDMTVVWKRISDDALFWATDSGCSCPSPFEDYRDVESLTPLNHATFGELEGFVRGHSHYKSTDKVDFLGKVRRAVTRRA